MSESSVLAESIELTETEQRKPPSRYGRIAVLEQAGCPGSGCFL